MVPDFIKFGSILIVLFTLIYFSMASLGFLLYRLDIPEVARLFRGLFNVYFWMVGFTSLVATAVFAASGLMVFTAGMLLLATTAMAVRGRVLHCIDTQQTAWQSGDTAAMRRLRLIHLGTMLVNIAILASVASSTRFIV
jgi:hypothetical protein